MIEGFRFSSDARPEATAFPDYVALYSHGADVTRGRGRFAAEIDAWRFDGVLLFDVAEAAVEDADLVFL